MIKTEYTFEEIDAICQTLSQLRMITDLMIMAAAGQNVKTESWDGAALYAYQLAEKIESLVSQPEVMEKYVVQLKLAEG